MTDSIYNVDDAYVISDSSETSFNRAISDAIEKGYTTLSGFNTIAHDGYFYHTVLVSRPISTTTNPYEK